MRTILSKQLMSLVVLDLAIIISWVAYHKYQPQIIQQFGLTDFLAVFIVIQGIILFITPPIAGWIADQMRKNNKERLTVINFGINVVSMVFMAVAMMVFAQPATWIKWLLPMLIVLWLISMNIFHSPAFSMMELFVPPEKLAQAFAILVFISTFAYAVEAHIIDFIVWLGPPLTFVVGGVLVFFTGWLLNQSTKGMETYGPGAQQKDKTDSNLMLVIAIGTMVGLATTVFVDVFPIYLAPHVSLVNLSDDGTLLTLLLILAAVFAFPAAFLVQATGLIKGAFISANILLLLTLGIIFINISVLVVIFALLYAILYAVLSVASLPIAFAQLAHHQKILGIGLFFSGVQLPSSILAITHVFA